MKLKNLDGINIAHKNAKFNQNLEELRGCAQILNVEK